ncbi:cytochrome b/b6 domain-containing protein [Halarcobacter anaerophilus]|uniref:cytochrome b/b6 domain-containing protein n=1 Tax=Halarcobacter anaerophilus TaxID=877500 RepID=UPI0005CA6EF0|nr:cytochrome b/b6 domain-containing protein [Halarcobacter anaerophilus]
MKNSKNKTYVWSFLGRLSHWMLVFSFFGCYITSFYENLLTLHIAIGITVFGMLLMKIVWGLIGPKYARWSDFSFSVDALKHYFLEKIHNRYRDINPGHNPASSWFAFLVTWIGILCCLSGFFLYGIQEARGIFSFLNENYISKSYILDNIHVFLVYILLLMIFAHISGVLIEQFYHKTDMVMAMVSGYKRAKGEDIKITLRTKVLGTIYIVLVIFVSFYTYYVPENIVTKSKFKEISYKDQNYDFYFECSDCHNLYPPFLLPKDSWIALMEDQHEHYDEDLELDESLVKNITSYLVTNSAENSTKESAFKFRDEIENSKEYTLTKTDYWKRTHKDIPDEIFENDIVETKSNCVACHKDFEKGILADTNITYPPKVAKK